MTTYRTSILKDYHPIFLEKIFYDDEILFVLPLLTSKTFVYFGIILYNYLLGRVGQSVDPQVTIRNIDFKVKTRKQIIEFYNNHPSQSYNVERKLQYILNTRIRKTYSIMARLPFRDSLNQMRSLSQWLDKEYPFFIGGKYIKLYRLSPLLYWLLFHYVRPLWTKIKKPFFDEKM